MKAVGRTVAKNFVKSVAKNTNTRNLSNVAKASTSNQSSNVKTASFSMPPRIQFSMNTPSIVYGNKTMDPVMPKGEKMQGEQVVKGRTLQALGLISGLLWTFSFLDDGTT